LSSKKLLEKDLFHEVLVQPALDGARELHIVSGYASPAMVSRHLNELQSQTNAAFQIDLLVGMTGVDGLPDHAMRGFKSIPRQSAGSRFNCLYTLPGKSIHAKVYVWSNDSGPYKAWMGSANYTQVGFGLAKNSFTHHELMAEVDPEIAMDYVLESSSNSISYLSPDLSKYLDITTEVLVGEGRQGLYDTLTNQGSWAPTVILPLVQLTGNVGEVHAKSGLNWGQRENRNPNQAYIPVPSKVRELEFFPPRGEHFQIITDDGESFIATIAQGGDKAIETPHDNALLGKYFRSRLGLSEGAFVTTEDLTKFGSNGVEIHRIGEGLFKLSFSPGIDAVTSLKPTKS
jgi:hypothetical protein